MLDRCGDICHLCGGPGADTVDHIQARALGGTDALDNLAPAHRFCNTGRGAADPARLVGRPLTVENTDRW